MSGFYVGPLAGMSLACELRGEVRSQEKKKKKDIPVDALECATRALDVLWG